ncbi:MAG: hypothetical protein OXC53_06430 [Rhodobacteraceae bacterium]|nr:hypothetical protein [Paracoccaceae bacterium]
MKSLPLMATVAFMLAYAQPIFAQHYQLDCEVSHYGKYSSGEARKVAESWFPQKSTHIISGDKSYHVEFGIIGTASQPRNRINFTYPLYSENGLSRPVKFTYLSQNDKLTGIMHPGVHNFDIQVSGKCHSGDLTRNQAAAYFR